MTDLIKYHCIACPLGRFAPEWDGDCDNVELCECGRPMIPTDSEIIASVYEEIH